MVGKKNSMPGSAKWLRVCELFDRIREANSQGRTARVRSLVDTLQRKMDPASKPTRLGRHEVHARLVVALLRSQDRTEIVRRTKKGVPVFYLFRPMKMQQLREAWVKCHPGVDVPTPKTLRAFLERFGLDQPNRVGRPKKK